MFLIHDNFALNVTIFFFIRRPYKRVTKSNNVVGSQVGEVIIISCLQWLSATARIHPSFLQYRLGSVSLRNVCSSSCCGSGRMWLRRTYSFCCPGSPTYVSLPGWQPVPSALGWMSAMHATAACDHSGVVILGRCCTSLDCCLFAPTVLATSRYGLLRAYTGEAGRLKRNCFESVGDSKRVERSS